MAPTGRKQALSHPERVTQDTMHRPARLEPARSASIVQRDRLLPLYLAQGDEQVVAGRHAPGRAEFQHTAGLGVAITHAHR